jgi:hypothetical protein
LLPLCASSLDVSTRRSHFIIFIQVGIYIHNKHADFTPCIFLPLNLYHPGTGDLNLPVLQQWWLEFNFGVMIFILKRVRQGLLDLHMWHYRRAMHGQCMLKMFSLL